MLMSRSERSQHDVAVPQLPGGHGCLAPQDCVNPSLLVGDLPASLETPDGGQSVFNVDNLTKIILPGSHMTRERLPFELFELNEVLTRFHSVAAGGLGRT